MRDLLKNTVAPISSLLIIMMGVSFFNTFVSVRVSYDGWSNFMIGALYSAYYAGMMTGTMYIEKIIKHTGFIRAFAMFASVVASSIILQGFTLSPYAWIFYRFITGLACSGVFIVVESWLLLFSSAKTRGVALSIYMTSITLAQTIGQFFLNFINIQELTAFSLTTIFCTISIIPVCLMRATTPTIHETEYVNIFYIFKKIPLGFIGNFIAGMMVGAFFALGPVFAKDSGLAVWQISAVMSTTILGGMIVQWPIGALSDIIDRRRVIIIASLILTTISLTLFIFSSITFNILLILLFLFGGFVFSIYPLSITYCCDSFSSAGITGVTCAALLIYGIGCILGPIISPIVMHSTSPNGLFLYSAILSLILFLIALTQKRSLSSKPPCEKEHFHIAPNIPIR